MSFDRANIDGNSKSNCISIQVFALLNESADVFLVRSDEIPNPSKAIGVDGLVEIEEGVYRICKITAKLLPFFSGNWILCAKVASEQQVDSLILAAEKYWHLYNYYGAADRVNKLIRNFAKSPQNCFLVTDPVNAARYSIIGNDALFKHMVNRLPDKPTYVPERGDLAHWKEKRRFFFPSRLKSSDRIVKLFSSTEEPLKIEKSVQATQLNYPTLHKQLKNSPGFPARPIDLRTIRERYGDHPVLAEIALHTGAEWLIDEENVSHLRFFTSPEIVDETQELMDVREDMDPNCAEIDNQTALVIAQFRESGDRICVLLSGPKAGAVAILSLDSDDAILAESFKEFVMMLDADAVSLLRKCGVADVALGGKKVKPYDV